MFHARAFLEDHFRNPATLRALCRAWGFAVPTTSACEKWWSRQSIPSAFLPILLAIAELERGEPIGISEYLEEVK